MAFGTLDAKCRTIKKVPKRWKSSWVFETRTTCRLPIIPLKNRQTTIVDSPR
uniref:Uncharacterized protein n=1 Tax=Rhizophora mucronata TaxID=61149 RepID=A0A2P2NGA0_RHIMU